MPRKLLLPFLIAFAWSTDLKAGIIRVDASAGGAQTGMSWGDAFTNLQDALAVAVEGDEIWIAEGVYYPDEGVDQTDDDPSATFYLDIELSLYGGFPTGGGDGTFSARDHSVFVTVLSGDIDQNDGPDFANNESNSRTMVKCFGFDLVLVIDGFDIVGSTRSGLNAGATSVTINDCDFTGNGGTQGGALSIGGGDPQITNCHFLRNRASSSGGAIYVRGKPTVTITDCSFVGNTASNGGAFFSNEPQGSGGPAVTRMEDCYFANNSASLTGGAMDIEAHAEIVRCVFFQNSSPVQSAGALKINEGVDAVISECVFESNDSRLSPGGAVYVFVASPSFTNCIFKGNSAYGGGAIHSLRCPSILMANCVFSGNHSEAGGGAVSNVISSPRIVNCTFSGNRSEFGGGAITNKSGTTPGNPNTPSRPQLINTIIWNNEAIGLTDHSSSSVSDSSTSWTTYSYCLVQNLDPFGEGNIDGAVAENTPLFLAPITPDQAPTTEGDFRLTAESHSSIEGVSRNTKRLAGQ